MAEKEIPIPLIEEIKNALATAAINKTKTAAFHCLVLIHADDLANINASEFCRLVDVKKSYETEFRKMLAASRKLNELRYTIQHVS